MGKIAIATRKQIIRLHLCESKQITWKMTSYFQLTNNMHREKEILENKIEQYTSDLAASKEEYEKPFLHEKELEEKLARQCELNAQLDLENSKTVDADISGITEEPESIKVAEQTRSYGRRR